MLIDARGTGKSSPLHCRQLQYKEHLEQQFEEMYPVAAVKDCYDSLAVSFYETVLGFKGKSDFPNFASLTKGNVEIMFVVPQDDDNDCEVRATRTFFLSLC